MDGLVIGHDGRARCWWSDGDELYRAYHDDEWGRPLREERALFELLCLEGFQAGLAWITILRKRPAFREAFAGFEPSRVAAFDAGDRARLLADPRIIRHAGKIEATIANAQALLAAQAAGESLSGLAWKFAAPPERPRPRATEEIPAQTTASRDLSDALHRRGFRFVGPTTVYAFMQSAGIVDDHLAGCWVVGG
jgi:DNA-3-methyladenine glycosylase I